MADLALLWTITSGVGVRGGEEGSAADAAASRGEDDAKGCGWTGMTLPPVLRFMLGLVTRPS